MAETTSPVLEGTIDFRALARNISLVENEVGDYARILKNLVPSPAKIIGITGAPGAGKSSLVDALIGEITRDKKKVGVLCVDPSSPFNRGALLGDRIRMSEWYNHPDVYIRSLASKGFLGGLHPRIIEITDVMKGAGFDYIVIETVGVGQSEVDIAALADTTVVVLVPEGGDIIQTMKAGLMEVADIFIINKFDRPEADSYFNNLKQMLAPAHYLSQKEIPVLKTIATRKEGVHELFTILSRWQRHVTGSHLEWLVEKAWLLIEHQKMKTVDREALKETLSEAITHPDFNIYRWVEKYR